MERVEDAALLTGRGRFADDVGERPGTAHAAVLRSPHAHAEIVSLDAAAALSMPGVVTVLTGEDVVAWSRPFIAGVKQPMRHYALAVDRVRYAGEPVAVVVARDRYGAEDALERIEVEYRELAPVVDPVAAAALGAPLLHRDVGSNVVSDRHFHYGDPDTAFANAAHRVAISVCYPRNACTPIEGVRRGRRAPRGTATPGRERRFQSRSAVNEIADAEQPVADRVERDLLERLLEGVEVPVHVAGGEIAPGGVCAVDDDGWLEPRRVSRRTTPAHLSVSGGAFVIVPAQRGSRTCFFSNPPHELRVEAFIFLLLAVRLDLRDRSPCLVFSDELRNGSENRVDPPLFRCPSDSHRRWVSFRAHILCLTPRAWGQWYVTELCAQGAVGSPPLAGTLPEGTGDAGRRRGHPLVGDSKSRSGEEGTSWPAPCPSRLRGRAPELKSGRCRCAYGLIELHGAANAECGEKFPGDRTLALRLAAGRATGSMNGAGTITRFHDACMHDSDIAASRLPGSVHLDVAKVARPGQRHSAHRRVTRAPWEAWPGSSQAPAGPP